MITLKLNTSNSIKYKRINICYASGKNYDTCLTTPTPSNDDPICKKFFDSMSSQDIKLPGKKDTYSISYWNKTTVSTRIR